MKYYLILTILLVGSVSSNPLYHCYAPFLGNKNAHEYYTQQVQDAAADFGYKKTIPVKQMNTMVNRLMGGHLLSFTMFGIWLNQDSLDACDSIERTWIIYHEVAHYLAGHHARVLGLLALVGPFIGINHSYIKNKWGSIMALISSGLCTYRLKSYVLKPYVKAQEKEADLRVLRLFCKIQKYDLIEKYLDHLRVLIQEGKGDETDGWHYTIQEQFEYLNSTYISLIAQVHLL